MPCPVHAMRWGWSDPAHPPPVQARVWIDQCVRSWLNEGEQLMCLFHLLSASYTCLPLLLHPNGCRQCMPDDCKLVTHLRKQRETERERDYSTSQLVCMCLQKAAGASCLACAKETGSKRTRASFEETMQHPESCTFSICSSSLQMEQKR